MNKAIKAKWLRDLRDPTYIQGRNQLCIATDEGEDPEYCCLGVLVESAGHYLVPKHKKGKDPGSDLSARKITYSIDYPHAQSYSLSSTIMRETRLTGDITFKLMKMNDIQKWSFPKIANWIERYL